jgi:hypothetical protein
MTNGRKRNIGRLKLTRHYKLTPAMAAGVESCLWEIDDIVKVVEERERTNEV